MIRPILRLWAVSLMVSVVLVAAGQRWPQPLVPDAVMVVGLLLLPPLLTLLWLACNWRLPASPQAETGERGESQNSEAVHP